MKNSHTAGGNSRLLASKYDWKKNTSIKDAVHGYIHIPTPITKLIIDHELFQRLKGIEQTGMQVLYPSATHNRFTHSLGVYHLGTKAFACFRSNIKDQDELKTKDTSKIYPKVSRKKPEATWDRWELLFRLACLLHDCGHSPFSHTLEFVYELELYMENLDAKDVRLNQELCKCFDGHFQNDFYTLKANIATAKGKPHERMSAYFIATEYKDSIRTLVSSYIGYLHGTDPYDGEKGSDQFNDDLEFMVRMIIGCHYDYKGREKYPNSQADFANYEQWAVELQLRNCIIRLLNSELDVDNLDYTVRDALFSGYESSNIDLDRLLKAFTITTAYQFERLSVDLEETGTVATNDSPPKPNNFRYSVRLAEFIGEGIFDASISGRCHIKSNVNMRAFGNVYRKDEEPSAEKVLNVFHTEDDFSARVEGSRVNIRPATGEKEAYLHIQGKLKGTFKGIIFGGDERLEVWCEQGKGELLIYPAYNKSTLSVLQLAVDARNFEYMWVYAHHTTTYQNNFLYIYLLQLFSQYLFQIHNPHALKLREIITGIFAMYEKERLGSDWYHRSSDGDLLVQYKKAYLDIEDNHPGSFPEFIDTMKQLKERNYLQCLCKSYAEYQFYFRSWIEEEKALLSKFFRDYQCPFQENVDFQYCVLSDHVFQRIEGPLGEIQGLQKSFWEFIKNDFGITRFVYVRQLIRTKELNKQDTYIIFNNMTLRLSDIDLHRRVPAAQEVFCYFYYEQNDSEEGSNGEGKKEIDVFAILDGLKGQINEMRNLKYSDDYRNAASVGANGKGGTMNENQR